MPLFCGGFKQKSIYPRIYAQIYAAIHKRLNNNI